jgi:hypothetical protein
MAFIVVAPIAYAILAFVIRPSVYRDSAEGFLAWQSFLQTGTFNVVVSPDPNNLLQDTGSFLAAWSPGQYLAPGLLSLPFGDLGFGVVAATALASALGLAGFYKLYRAFGFDRNIAVATCILIACSRHFILPFGIYNGGEVILFGVAPWAALAMFETRNRIVPFAISYIAALVLCTAAKLSGLILVAGMAGGIGMIWLLDHQRSNLPVRVPVGLAVSAGFLALFYYFWLSQGSTPVDAVGGPRASALLSHAIPMAPAAVFSAVSLGDLLARLFLFPGNPVFESIALSYALFLPAAGFIVWRMATVLRRTHPDYVVFSLTCAALVVLTLTFLYMRGAAVDVSERNLRMASLLCLPGVLHSIISLHNRWLKAPLVLILAVCTLYGIASAAPRFMQSGASALGTSGLRIAEIDREALRYLVTRIEDAGDAERGVFYLPTPTIAISVPAARMITSHADFESVEMLAERAYYGRPPFIVVALQSRLRGNGKADAILRSFRDVRPNEWRMSQAGDFVFYEFQDAR